MKAIIFDIDGVVIKSNSKKNEVIKNILIKYNLYNIPGVIDIVKLGLNRKLILDKIYELKTFNNVLPFIILVVFSLGMFYYKTIDNQRA